ncbi:MAG: hypothetical protein BWY73_00426 [candidate division TA06 bacterium ADurb.Bin417]|uniref:Uncharacterized protein n=1 Tax=candidate division TA06 bacterium ADurb.Bin417 TaxID=1852828 RepID=A0A1V5MJ60_UNCT6|nr:MAG: hypothetical protein BWY73_00426 [candidate division TA06 bacterium ADurb.Bin417]
MAGDPVLPAGRQALHKLVAALLHLGRHRQHPALVIGQPAPGQIGQDGGKPVFGQDPDRLVPIHSRRTKGAVAPPGPVLAGNRPLHGAVSGHRRRLGLPRPDDRPGKILPGRQPSGLGAQAGRALQFAAGGPVAGRPRPQCRGRLLPTAERTEAADRVQAGPGRRLPEFRNQPPQHGQQQHPLVIRIVRQQNVRQVGGALRDQDGRLAGRLAPVIEPGGGHAAAPRHRLVAPDVPGPLLHLGRRARQFRAERTDRSELAAVGLADMGTRPHPGGLGQPAGQRGVKGKQLAAARDEIGQDFSG